MAVTYSLPLSNVWETKTQLQYQMTLLPQRRDLDRTISWLPHTTKENKNPHVGSHQLKSKQTHAYNMATASAMSIDELFSYIQGLFAHLFQKFADFTYVNYRQEFGIKDPIKEKFLF